MLRLLRYFRPLLEWLEGRFAPAAVVAPFVAPPAVTAAPPRPVDLAARDAVFSGDSVGLLPYLSLSPAITPAGSAAAAALSDAVFGDFTYLDPDTELSATDAVFAGASDPSRFTFVPPPAPKALAPTPYGAGSVRVAALVLTAGEVPEEDAAPPDADFVHAEAGDLVEV